MQPISQQCYRYVAVLILTAKNALFKAQRSGRNAVFSCKSEWYARAAERKGA